MTELYSFVKEVGVPAAIAFFVLWRLEHRLAQLNSSIVELIAYLKEQRREDYQA